MSVIVSNNAFTSPPVGVGNKLDITNVTDITNWTVSGFTNADVKLLNLIDLSDNVAPYNWDNVPVKTVLYVAQTDVTTTDITYSIDISNIVIHEMSIWTTNRNSSYNNSQSFSLLIDDEVIIGPITFTTGSTNTPWTKYTGNYTPSTTGSKTLKLRWNNTDTNDTAIMVTSVSVKEPASFLRTNGYTVQQLIDLGYSLQEMKDGGYIASQLKVEGFSITQLLSVGFTNIEVERLLSNVIDISNNNLRLWLDAKDPSGNGTELSSNTTRSLWIDKSQYKNHARALTLLYQPTNIEYQVAGFNSYYPTFNFIGNGDRFAGTFPASHYTHYSGYTNIFSNISGNSMRVFIVGSLASDSPTNSRFIGFSTNYTEGDHNGLSRWGFSRAGGTGVAPLRNGVYVNNNPSDYNLPLIWSAWFDGTKAYANFLNGDSTATVSYNSTGNLSIKHFSIGNNTRFSPEPESLKGKISEVLVYNGVLTDANVAQIEGHLAWKWGLTSTLPSNHPYKNVNPTNAIPASEFVSAGYTLSQLKNLYSISSIIALGYTLSQMKSAGYTATELKSANYTATQMKAAGYTALELKDGGYTALELKDGGYTLKDIRDGGYTVKNLLDASYTETQILNSVSPINTSDKLSLWLDAMDPSANGQKITSNTTLPTWIDKSQYGNNATAITITDETTSINYKVNGLNSAYPSYSFTASDRKRMSGQFAGASNITGSNIHVFSVSSIPNDDGAFAGRLIGFTNTYKNADYNNISSLIIGRYGTGATGTGIFALRAGQYDFNSAPAYDTPLIRQSWFDGTKGYSKYLNGDSSSESSFNSSGNFDINYFSVGGTTYSETNPVAYISGEISEILVYDGSLNSTDISKIEGYLAWKWGLTSTLPSNHAYKTVNPLITITASEFVDAGYTATQLKNLGYKISDLNTYFTGSQLKDAGFTARELKSVNFTAAQLKSLGYSALHINAADFTLAQLRDIGFTALELKTSGFSIQNIRSAGYSVKNLFDASYNGTEIFNSTKVIDVSSNLSLWLDATDPLANGQTISSDTTLSSWNDKSQYGNNASALTYPDVPTTVTYKVNGLNSSYPSYSFTASNSKRMTGQFATGSSITGTTIHVFSVSSVPNDDGAFAGRLIGFTDTYKNNDYNNAASLVVGRYGTGESGTGIISTRDGVYVLNNPPSYNTPIISQTWFDGTKGYSKYLNGDSSSEAFYNSSGNFNINHFAVGGATNGEVPGASYITGEISEILVFNGTLTSSYISEIEGYLAWKWGLTSTLPSNHPYKSVNPNSAIPVTEFIDVSYTLLQLKNLGYKVADLKTYFTGNDLKTEGFTALDLKNEGFTGLQLKGLGYNASNMKTAGFTLAQLKDLGYVAADLKIDFTGGELKQAGFTAADLKTTGFIGSELKQFGYDAGEMRLASYSATDLRDLSYNLTDIKNGGYFISQVRAAGYTVSELLGASYTEAEIFGSVGNIDFTSSDLRLWLDASDPSANGVRPTTNTNYSEWMDKSIYKNNSICYNINGQVATRTVSLTGFQGKYPAFVFDAGWDVNQFRFMGQFSNDSKISGNTTTTFVVANVYSGGNIFWMNFSNNSGVGGWQVFQQGHARRPPSGEPNYFGTYLDYLPTDNLYRYQFTGANKSSSYLTKTPSGYANPVFPSTGAFDITQYSIGGLGYNGSFFTGNISEILYFNSSLSDSEIRKVEGYLSWKWGLTHLLPDNHPYKNALPISEFVDAGYTLPQLKNMYSIDVIKPLGYTVSQMRDVSYNATEMKNAGYNATELYYGGNGYTAAEMRTALFTAAQLKNAGYNGLRLKEGGYTATNMKDATYNATDLYTLGYLALDMKTAGFTASELRTGGYSGLVLKEAGYNASNMKDASYNATDLRGLGYTAEDLTQGGYTGIQLKQGGYKAAELKQAGYNVYQLRELIYDIVEIKKSGFTVSEMLSGGFSNNDVESMVNSIDISNNNLRLWLDAKDPSGNGTVISSDTTLSGWMDKSQYKNNTVVLNNSNASSTISYQTSGFNSSYPTYNFTGNGNRLVGTFPIANGSNISSSSMRVFIVGSLSQSPTAPSGRFIGFSDTYLNADYLSGGWNFSRAPGRRGLLASRNGGFVYNDPPSYNMPLLWQAWFDGSKSYTSFLNGDSTTTASYNSTGNFNIQHFSVGHNTDPTDIAGILTGKLSEILVFNGTLTSSDVERIEGYLAWKWGLQSKLPTTHAYKNSLTIIPAQEFADASYNMAQIKGLNYTAAALKSEGFQASKLLGVYSASEARIGGYSILDLSGGGYTKSDIIGGGFAAYNLRVDGGYKADDLKNNYTIAKILEGGYTAELLAGGTFTASEMRIAGFSPKQLQNYGYQSGAILGAGYSATDLKGALYKVADLKPAGYNISDIRGGGYSPGEAFIGGFGKLEIAQGGYTAKQLRDSGIEATFLRQAGFIPKNLIDVNYPTDDILGAGFTASQLRQANYTVSHLQRANYSKSSILGAGFSAKTLFDNGFTNVQDLKENNYTASAIRIGGYPESNILSAGFGVTDLRDASFSALQLKNNNYTARELVLGNYPRADVLALDFSANDFRTAEFTSSELKTRGLTISDLKTGGYNDSEILSAGYDASLLKQANYTATQLMQNAYTISHLKNANYDTNVIINAGYTPNLLNQNGYTAKQLQNNNFTISALKQGLYLDSDILSAGYSAQSLKDASYNVTQLKQNNYEPFYLREAGYNDSDILGAGFSATDLQKANFTAKELKNNNYSVDSLITAGYASNYILDAGYTAGELRTATLRVFSALSLRQKKYTVLNLIEGGYLTSQIIGAGYLASELLSFYTVAQLKDTYTPLQLKSGGFDDNDILSASFTAAELKKANFTAYQLRLAGYTISQLITGPGGYTRSEILAGGFDSSELKLENFTATELKQNGYTIQSLIDASYNDSQILSAGYLASDLISMGYTASQLYSNNYTALQLKDASYNDIDILGLGYSIQQLKSAGYLPFDLQSNYLESEILSGGFTAGSLNAAGYNVSQLKQYNYTVQKLKEGLYNNDDILSAGYGALELKQNSYTATNLYENNYTASELREAGYSVSELQTSGYSIEQILYAGYLASKLKEVGYTSTLLKTASYSALQLKTGQYPDEEVLSIGYSVKELTIAGYTVDQMKQYGYSDGTILTGISNAIETLPNPPVITNIVTGNSTAYVYFTDLSNSDVPIIGYKYTLNGDVPQFWSKNDDSPLVILGLENGTSYDIGIYTVNRNGMSVMSNLIEGVIPSDVPSQPVIVNGISENGIVSFEYIDGDVNGSDVTEYYYSVDSVNYILTEPYGNIISINGLNGNQMYNITIKTKNANGFSEKSNVLRIKNVGSMVAPVITDVSFNNRTGYVYYTIDSSLNKIFYKYSLNNSDYLYFSDQDNPLIINNLSSNDTYSIKIKSEHFIYGESNESNALTFTTMSEPSQSTILSANYFNGTMTINTIVGEENGSPITNYYYSLNDSSYSYIGNIEDSVITIQRVINTSVSNTIKIKSENLIGMSEESNSATLTYKILPDKPNITSVSAGDKSCSIYYTDGDVYNSPILCYKYKLSNDPTVYIAKQMSNPIVIDGLINGTNYTVKIKTVCQSGESEYSNVSETFMPFGVPSPPTITSIEPRVDSLLVNFEPGNNGGLEILGYKYSVSNGPLMETTSKTSPILITGLVNKTTFFITLYAYNSQGLSGQSNSQVGVPGVPTAPIINSVATSDSTFTINYTQSAINNGSAVIKMFYTFDNINILQFTSITNPLVIKNAVNGRSYNIKILSSNMNGYSPMSNSVNAIINVPPAKLVINSVTLLLESASTCYAVVNINTPNNNGSPITKYKYALGLSNTYTDLPSTNLPLVIPNLPINTSLIIKLIATNLYGDSQPSLPSKSVKYALEVPARPVLKGVTMSLNSMLINFVKPKTVGADITTYKYSLNNGPYIDISSNILPFTVPTENNRQYNVQVIASNIFGDSLASAPLSKTVSYVYLSPLAPKIDSITGSNNSLIVNFTAPVTRGAPVTNYSYSLDPSSSIISTQTTSSPLEITGLTNGTNYQINLYANSLAGMSPASNLVAATPIYSVPGTPVITSIEPLNNSCSVTLGPQVINGSPITTYLYSLDGGNTLIDSNRATSRFLINDLVNGTSYNVQVVAVNALGNSLLSLPKSVTPIYTVPSAPLITTVRVGVGNVAVVFTPSLPNGSTIKSYYYSFDNGVTLIDTSRITSPITISNLTSSFTYTIRLYALNDLGYSPASTATNFTVR